ncbi:MAG: right-handed parallel beta-helix repeat-containing protein [Kiritimatiellae bacterium]|nr:right-handed parallel beta-helix repeat-containing protein [Kiritimatiellia bacterium]
MKTATSLRMSVGILLGLMAARGACFAEEQAAAAETPGATEAERPAPATYYAATDGADTNPGTQEAPFRTLQKAVDSVRAGDTVIVRGGRYAGFRTRNLQGAPGAPITIRAADGEKATLDGFITPSKGQSGYVIMLSGLSAYLVLDGLEITNSDPKLDELRAVELNDQADANAMLARAKKELTGPGMAIRMEAGHRSHHVIFRNLDVHRFARMGWSTGDVYHCQWLNNHVYDLGRPFSGYAWYVKGEHNVWRGNIVHDCNYGFHLYGNSRGRPNPTNDSIIENNLIFNNGLCSAWIHGSNRGLRRNGTAFYLSPGSGNVIRNNLLFNNYNAMYLTGENKIVNNTFHQNRKTTILSKSAKNVIVNNIFCSTAKNVLPAGTALNNNVTDDPLFVDAAAGDYHLQAKSPAIDAGVALPEVTEDFDGVTRPQGAGCDAGAYEYKPGSGGRAAPATLSRLLRP